MIHKNVIVYVLQKIHHIYKLSKWIFVFVHIKMAFLVTTDYNTRHKVSWVEVLWLR